MRVVSGLIIIAIVVHLLCLRAKFAKFSSPGLVEHFEVIVGTLKA